MKVHFKRLIKNKRENGIALIAVLSLLVIISLLTATAVTLSQYSALETETVTERVKARYIAEGALNRSIYFLLNDIHAYTIRKLGIDYAHETEERYMADNVIHELAYYNDKVELRIQDALSGLDISGTAPDHVLLEYMKKVETDMAEFEEFRDCLNRLLDYVDTDDFIRNGGMEALHYRQQNIPILPRNSSLQFKEELLNIPGLSKYFPADCEGYLSNIRLIAPKGLRSLGGRSNLYAVPLSMISATCNLNPMEETMLKTAMQSWCQKRIPLWNNLFPGLLGRLQMAYSTHESGTYTFLINTSGAEAVGIKLRATLRLNTTAKQFEFYEFIFY